MSGDKITSLAVGGGNWNMEGMGDKRKNFHMSNIGSWGKFWDWPRRYSLVFGRLMAEMIFGQTKWGVFRKIKGLGHFEVFFKAFSLAKNLGGTCKSPRKR